MRIIIAGSRNFNDYEFLKQMVLPTIKLHKEGRNVKDFEIISGCASGADSLGIKFAEEMGYKLTKYPADWDAYGKSAGYIRNIEMAEYAKQDDYSCLIAFWDGKSKGTKHMIDIAKKKKLTYWHIYYYENMKK
jgi:hypothetical protein